MQIFRPLICTVGLILASLASSATAQDISLPAEIAKLYACKAISDADARLACYDGAVGKLETAQNAGEVVTVSKTQVENVEREAFGFNIPSLPSLGKLFGGSSKAKALKTPKDNPLTSPVKPPQVKSPEPVKTAEIPDIRSEPTPAPVISAPKASDVKKVSLALRKTTEFGYKKTRFFFENGQVWEQTDAIKLRVPKVRNGVANNAVISKASLGSFFLRVNGKGTAVRVRRVR